MPNLVNSNIENGEIPFGYTLDTCSSINELTTKFVDVPISVNVPPKIAAYDNGNKSFEGLILNFWHKFVAKGINIATEAVLLINPEINATVSRKINIVNHLWFPP